VWSSRNHYNQSNTKAAKAARTFNGIEFDSQVEMVRYRDYLKLLLACRDITDLIFQPRFYLDVYGFRLGFYTADFQYKTALGTTIIEEIKGNKENREFSIKWKLVQILYPQYKFIYLRGVKRGCKYIYSVVKREAKTLKTPLLGGET